MKENYLHLIPQTIKIFKIKMIIIEAIINLNKIRDRLNNNKQ